MTTAKTITHLIVKRGSCQLARYISPPFHLPSSPHMLKSQRPKKSLKRKRSAVDVLLCGLGRIVADLHSYGTLSDEPLKPLQMLNVPPALPLQHVSNSFAPPASQVQVICLFVHTLDYIYASDLGKQMQGRGPRRSTSCSKTLTTLSCTGEIFRLNTMLFNLTPHFTAHITNIYCRTCKLLPPE